MSADLRLRSLIDRVLRLKEEQDSLAADIRDIYAEAKSDGYDKTTMGQIVAYLRKVEKVGVSEVEEGQTKFDLYLQAYQHGIGTPIATHTHEAAEIMRQVESGKIAAVAHDAETGEIIDTSSLPTSSPAVKPDETPTGEPVSSGTLSPAASPQAVAPEPTPVPTNGSGAPNLPATASEEPVDGSPATAQMGPHAVTVVGSESGTFTPPAFLLTDSKPYVLRPHCAHPNDLDKGAGVGSKHCHECSKAMAAETEAA